MTFFNNRYDSFDVLFRNLFDNSSFFSPVFDTDLKQPIDISTSADGLRIEIAVVGASDEDVSVTVSGDSLGVKYTNPIKTKAIETTDDIADALTTKKNIKDSDSQSDTLLYKGIKRRSFDFAWKISQKFNLSKLSAKLDKGLLTIDIPLAESIKPEVIKIELKK